MIRTLPRFFIYACISLTKTYNAFTLRLQQRNDTADTDIEIDDVA